MDDTLYSERQFSFSGFEAVVEQFADRLGWGATHTARMRSLFDTDRRASIFNAMLEESSVESERHPTLVAEMVDVFRRHSPRITLHPDADRALSRLAGRYRMGIISDGFLQTQQAKVDALQLKSRVDHIVLTDAWGRDHWKPHPKAFECMAAELGTSHEACVYIADNPTKDFLAPRRLGWKTIQILRPDGIYYQLDAPPDGRPTSIIHTLDDLDPLLGA